MYYLLLINLPFNLSHNKQNYSLNLDLGIGLHFQIGAEKVKIFSGNFYETARNLIDAETHQIFVAKNKFWRSKPILFLKNFFMKQDPGTARLTLPPFEIKIYRFHICELRRKGYFTKKWPSNLRCDIYSLLFNHVLDRNRCIIMYHVSCIDVSSWQPRSLQSFYKFIFIFVFLNLYHCVFLKYIYSTWCLVGGGGGGARSLVSSSHPHRSPPPPPPRRLRDK